MTSDWEKVPLESDFRCRKCGSGDIEYRVVESYDGAHEDYKYHCKGCERVWWAEGSDY